MSIVDPSRDPDPIEQLLLTAYPNPERKGCPGRDVLANLAGKERDADDPNWYHVWHCSPCYAEFKQLRDARWEWEKVQKHRRSRATWIAVAAAALVLIVSGAALWIQRNRQPSPVEVAQVTLDLSDLDAKRDVGQDHAIRLHPVPRKVDDVRIILPRFSDEGKYTVAVLKSKNTDVALAVGKAPSVKSGGQLILSVKLDLSQAAPGTYLLETRLDGGDQIYYYPFRVE
jgi:hypothetical protein